MKAFFYPGQTPVPAGSGTWIIDLSHDPIWAIWLAEVRKFHQHHDRMSNCVLYKIIDVITYPCQDFSSSVFVQGIPACRFTEVYCNLLHGMSIYPCAEINQMMNYVNGIVAMFHLAFEGRNIRSPRSEYHYNDVIMGAIASQITSLTIVYSTVYSDADQRKHQSFASLAFVRGIHRGPVNSRHKWPVTRKMFPFDDVFMHQFCMIAVSGLDYVSVSIFFSILLSSQNYV